MINQIFEKKFEFPNGDARQGDQMRVLSFESDKQGRSMDFVVYNQGDFFTFSMNENQLKQLKSILGEYLI